MIDEITSPNWVRLEGAVNVRDLGGMPVRNGTTRNGVLFRGDNMAELSTSDVQRLAGELGIVRLIDLRTMGEREESGISPLCASGVAVDHLPLIQDADLERRRAMLHAAATSPDARPFANGYDEYLTLGRDSIAKAFRTLAGSEGIPALIHCTVGRDRTGVLAAIMLEAVGVDRRWIVADYAATNQRAGLLAARLARLTTYERQAAHLTAAGLETRASTMAEFLSLLDEKFGGPTRWLGEIGISPETIADWERRFVVRA